MKSRIGCFLLIVLFVLLSACNAFDGSGNAGVTRDQAIQTVKSISNGMGDVDIHSLAKKDQVVNHVRYYFVQVVYANKMSAAYFVSEKTGDVFIAMGGELDTSNPLPTKQAVAATPGPSDQDSQEQSETAQIDKPESAAVQELFQLIGQTGEQVEKAFGKDYKNVSVNYHGEMKAFLYSDKGVTVAFASEGTVTRIYCSDQIDLFGAKSGMNFSQIQELLGETSIRQTWVETPINTAYEIKYRCHGRTILFFSREKEGNNSILCIS